MNILKPVDVENEIRLALSDLFDVYVRPLPESYPLPCLLVTATGGSTRDTVDTFTVRIDARAKTDADAVDILTDAIGVIEEKARQQVGAIRHVIMNGLASWGSDPARPDLKLCTATFIVVAHRQAKTIKES